MAKRANGEGSIYKTTSKGYTHWRGSVTLSGGKRKTVQAKTRGEVLRKLAELRTMQAQGVKLPARGDTVGAWLDRYVAIKAESPQVGAGQLRNIRTSWGTCAPCFPCGSRCSSWRPSTCERRSVRWTPPGPVPT